MGIISALRKIGASVSSVAKADVPKAAATEARVQRFVQRYKPAPPSPRAMRVINKTQEFMEHQKLITKGKVGKSTKYRVAGGITYVPTKRGVSTKGAGRPRLSYKPRVDPLTGRTVVMPAPQFYKRQRLARKLASARHQQVQIQKAQYYQQRGIPPQQAAQIEQIRQQRMIQQMEQLQQPPQQIRQIVRREYSPTPRFPMEQRQATIKPDFFRGGTVVAPKERWLQ